MRARRWILCSIWHVLLIAGCEIPFFNTPQVVDYTPSRTLLDHPPKEIVIRFSMPMDRIISERAFSIHARNIPIAGRFEWRADERSNFRDTIMVFRPDIPFVQGIPITMQLAPTAENTMGLTISQGVEISFIFGTSDPHVVSVAPHDKSIITTLRPSIRLEYAAPVIRNNFYHTFSITPPLDGIFEWHESDRVVEFIPRENVRPDTEYHVRATETQVYTFRTARTTPLTSEIILRATDLNEVRRLLPRRRHHINSAAHNDTFLILFGDSVPLQLRNHIISMRPMVKARYRWNEEWDECIVIPEELLSWQQRYTINIEETNFDFIVDDIHSMPPQVTQIYFIDDPTMPAPQLLSYGGYIDFGDSPIPDAAFDIEFYHAPGAAVTMVSVAAALSIQSAGGGFNFLINDIETIDVLPPRAERYTLFRVMVAIERDRDSSDIIEVRIGDDFHDTYGNYIAQPFIFEFNGL